jgi:hypothetical protein
MGLLGTQKEPDFHLASAAFIVCIVRDGRFAAKAPLAD